MTKKRTHDDSDGWNDNYDGNNGNEEEKLPKTIQILWLLSTNWLILGTITWLEKRQTIQAGALIRAMPESKLSFSWEVFPNPDTLDEGFPCEGFLLSSSAEACVRVSLREGSHVSNFWGNGN